MRPVLRLRLVEMAEDHRGIFAGQGPLHAPLGRVAERIERRSAQELEPRQEVEGAEDPGTELALAQMPGHLVARSKQRRREANLDARVTVELFLQRLAKLTVRVKPGDLILVFVGHQLEQALGKSLGEVMRTGRALGFGCANALDFRQIALRISLILIVRQEFCAERDALIERPLRRLSAGTLEARGADDA